MLQQYYINVCIQQPLYIVSSIILYEDSDDGKIIRLKICRK